MLGNSPKPTIRATSETLAELSSRVFKLTEADWARIEQNHFSRYYTRNKISGLLQLFGAMTELIDSGEAVEVWNLMKEKLLNHTHPLYVASSRIPEIGVAEKRLYESLWIYKETLDDTNAIPHIARVLGSHLARSIKQGETWAAERILEESVTLAENDQVILEPGAKYEAASCCLLLARLRARIRGPLSLHTLDIGIELLRNVHSSNRLKAALVAERAWIIAHDSDEESEIRAEQEFQKADMINATGKPCSSPLRGLPLLRRAINIAIGQMRNGGELYSSRFASITSYSHHKNPALDDTPTTHNFYELACAIQSAPLSGAKHHALEQISQQSDNLGRLVDTLDEKDRPLGHLAHALVFARMGFKADASRLLNDSCSRDKSVNVLALRIYQHLNT